MSEPTIAALMTRSVITVAPQTPFKTVVDLLLTHGIGSVAVVDPRERIVGVVAESDLLVKERRRQLGAWPSAFAILRHWRRWPKSDGWTAADVMTGKPRTVREDDTLGVAVRALSEHDVRRVYVVDSGGRVVGVLSRRDVLGVFLRSDEEIRDAVLRDVIEPAAWAARDKVTVRVVDGVVTVAGNVERSSEAISGARLIEGIPGVVGVRNQLRYAVDDTVPAG